MESIMKQAGEKQMKFDYHKDLEMYRTERNHVVCYRNMKQTDEWVI